MTRRSVFHALGFVSLAGMVVACNSDVPGGATVDGQASDASLGFAVTGEGTGATIGGDAIDIVLSAVDLGVGDASDGAEPPAEQDADSPTDAGASHAGDGDSDDDSNPVADAGAGDDSEEHPDAGLDSGTPDEPVPSTVRGKVIDYNRNPVPQAVVRVADTRVTTGADGSFEFENVPENYDIAVSLRVARVGGLELAAWMFVGLTRRDPTLQVYRGLPLRSGNVMLGIEGVAFPLPVDEEIRMAFAGTYGTLEYELRSAGVMTSLTWQGPQAVRGTGHALHWTNATEAPGLPTSYLAHDTRAIALDAANASRIIFDLEASSRITTDLIAGKVSSPTSNRRKNAMFARFADGAIIQLVDELFATEDFSYLVPLTQNTSFVVAATESGNGYAAAYSDGVTPGTSDMALEIPVPATPLGPGHGASNVDGDTMFTWTGPDQVYMFRATSSAYYETFYVVTAAKEARLPVAPFTDLPLVAGDEYQWSVRTHNHYASVDDATGRDGQFDAYCLDRFSGPGRGAGTHTESFAFRFNAAP